jgi:hypothetical protein
MDHVQANKVSDTIMIDFIGPLPRGVGNKQYILTILCSFSKFVQYYTLTKATAQSAVRSLADYTARFGFPRNVVCASQFRSEIFQNYCRGNGISISYLAVYSHQANQSELYNGLLEAAIARMIASRDGARFLVQSCRENPVGPKYPKQ